MQLVLLLVTGLSLLLALALGAMLWHVLRCERARSEARVALLQAAARDTPAISKSGIVRAPDPPLDTADDMFALGMPTSPPRVSMAVLVTAALCATVVLVIALQLFGSPAPVTSSRAAAEGHPLELLTLHHAPDQGGLTISGLARNPFDSPRRTGVMVVVSALDAGGREIGSSRAALDHVILEPGTESPFVIKVAVAGIASRYRVGFRGTDGTVIAHVDRRWDDVSRSHSPIGGSPWVR